MLRVDFISFDEREFSTLRISTVPTRVNFITLVLSSELTNWKKFWPTLPPSILVSFFLSLLFSYLFVLSVAIILALFIFEVFQLSADVQSLKKEHCHLFIKSSL